MKKTVLLAWVGIGCIVRSLHIFKQHFRSERWYR